MVSNTLWGLVGGLWIAGMISLLLNRCRFGLHRWGAWTFDSKGTSQFRICQRCNFYNALMFRDSRTGEQLQQTRKDVTEPASERIN